MVFGPVSIGHLTTVSIFMGRGLCIVLQMLACSELRFRIPHAITVLLITLSTYGTPHAHRFLATLTFQNQPNCIMNESRTSDHAIDEDSTQRKKRINAEKYNICPSKISLDATPS